MKSEWRKSTYSGGANNACVEVAVADTVLVRDTADRNGCTLSVSVGAWVKFAGTVK